MKLESILRDKDIFNSIFLEYFIGETMKTIIYDFDFAEDLFCDVLEEFAK